MKNALKGWVANVRGDAKQLKKQLTAELQALEDLEECGALSCAQFIRKGQVQQALMKIYEEEESYWHKKSSEKWLLKEDSNTEYFHRVANDRRRKKMIFSMKDDQVTIQGTPDLLKHATKFYKDLFGHVSSSGIKLSVGDMLNRYNHGSD